MKPNASLLRKVGVTFLLSLPLGGFLFGFAHAEPPGIGGLLIGPIFAVLVPLSLGFPPRNEGGVGGHYNAWPHIGVAFLILVALQYLRWARSQRSSK